VQADLMFPFENLIYRIVHVDLKFPPKPIVSSGAKDLISQVCCQLSMFMYLFKRFCLSNSFLFLFYFLFFYWQMLVKDSSQRLPLHKLLEHPWIVQNAESSGVYRG